MNTFAEKMTYIFLCFCLNNLLFSTPSCLAEAPSSASPSVIVHPIFRVSNFSQLKVNQLESASFKDLNDCFLNQDAHRYYYSEVVEIEDKVLETDRLSKLLSGRSPSEVANLIGLPRLKTRRIVDLVSDEHDQNWLYYFGYMPWAIRVAFHGNCCVGAFRNEFKQRAAMEQAAFVEIKKHAIGKTAEEIEQYLQHKLVSRLIPSAPVLPIPVRYNGPAEKEFVIGDDFVWTFHFTDGKCSEISESIVLG